MAKQQNAKTGGGKQNPVNMGDPVARNKLAEGGRETKRSHRHAAEHQREASKASGMFYIVKNGDRSSDIYELRAGTVGLYAFPGGSQASVHLEVVDIGKDDQSFPVARFQGAHKEHQLPSTLSTNVNLPIFTLGYKHFKSRYTGEWAKTQEILWGHLTGLIDTAEAEATAKANAEYLESRWAAASESLDGFREAEDGALFKVHLLRNSDGAEGDVLIRIERKPVGPVIFIEDSTFEPIVWSDSWYLSAKCLESQHFSVKLQGELADWQREVHAALRFVLGYTNVTVPEAVAEVKADPAPPFTLVVNKLEQHTDDSVQLNADILTKDGRYAHERGLLLDGFVVSGIRKIRIHSVARGDRRFAGMKGYACNARDVMEADKDVTDVLVNWLRSELAIKPVEKAA